MCRSLLANYISWAAEDLDFLSCGNDLSNCQRSAFPAAYKPISCQHPMNPAHLIALIFIPFFHLSWKMSFCWCTPFVYGMYCQSSVSFCPYRISFGSVVRPQCYDFINQIKYILCRRERTSIVPNTSHTHTHTCPMIWCGAQLMFILMSQPRLIDSNADGPDQFEMWSSITSIRRFISQSQYSISASLVSIISKLSNSSIDTSKSYPVQHRHHHPHSTHSQQTWPSLSSSVLNKSHVVSKCLEFHAQLLYQQPHSEIEQFQKLFYFRSLERLVVK